MSYGCTVFNRFAIGEDEEEEDPFEALAKLEIKKKEEKEKSTQKTREFPSLGGAPKAAEASA